LVRRIGTGPEREKRVSVRGVSKVRGIFAFFLLSENPYEDEELWQGWEDFIS